MIQRHSRHNNITTPSSVTSPGQITEVKGLCYSTRSYFAVATSVFQVDSFLYLQVYITDGEPHPESNRGLFTTGRVAIERGSEAAIVLSALYTPRVRQLPPEEDAQVSGKKNQNPSSRLLVR